MIGNVLLCLPNHVNGNHVAIYRWLDGRGWSINAGNIHVEGFSIDEVVTNFQKYIHENNYEIVDEVVGYCLREVNLQLASSRLLNQNTFINGTI